MKASDLFVKVLEQEGVQYVFGIPGEETLDLLESLRDSSITLVLTRHEQAAAFMAATWGRLTGSVGVCLATLGPGATNLVTGAAYAQLGGMPLLMVTGQKPLKQRKQGLFQLVDVVGMMRPLTKYTRQLVHADNLPSALREAIRRAQEERPGAVHLELPEDVAAQEVEATTIVPSITAPASPSEAIIARAVEMIQAAHHPLLLLGAGSNREGVRSMVQGLVESTGIPFFTTQMGKGVIDEDHPLCIGTAALSEGDYVHCAIDYADLIINVGHDVIEKPPFIMRPDWPKVIHISRFSANVEAIYFPQLEIVGCIATTAQRLREALIPSPHWDFEYFKRAVEGATSHIHSKDHDDRFPIVPQRLVADVRRALPRDGIVALDNGMFKIWFARNFLAHEPNTVLLDNALATMGAGLPSAMAARLVYPQRKVMAVCGDGGFMMNSQEMETAIRLGMNLTVMVLRDDGYGMIKWKQQASALPNWGLDFGNPDFVAYARSYGAQGYRVEATEDLLPTLQRCLDRPGLHLVEVPVDYSENEQVLSEELRSKTCTL